MMHFILGRNSSGKSLWLHEHIKTHINHKKILVLVPEQYTLQAERELIEGLKSKGIMAVEIMSFNRLCYRLLEETGPLKAVPINGLGKAMVLRSLLDDHQKDLLVFKDLAKKTGFVEKLSQLISELKRAGVESSHLKSRLTNGTYATLVERKLHDIALILEVYENFMAKGYFDEEDQLQMVIEKTKESSFLEGAHLYLDGFDSFSSQEYLLIENLLGVTSDVFVSLTMDPSGGEASKALFAPVEKTLKRLKAIAKTVACDVKTIKTCQNHRSEDLINFEQAFFAQPYTVHEGPVKDIELHLCNDLYDEVDLLAGRILRQVKSEGLRFKDIGIVTGNIEGYASIVKRVFATYNIPYFIDEKVDVIHHPIIQYILSSLRAVNSGFKYEDVFKLVKTDLTPVKIKHSFELENYALSHGLRGKRWLKVIEDAPGLEEKKAALMMPLFALEEALKAAKDIKSLVTVLFEYMVEGGLADKIQVWIEGMKKKKALSHVQETTQVWNKVIEIFDQLVELEGTDEKNLKEFIMILEAGFTEIQLGLIPSSLDQVLVGTIERSRNNLVKHMYVLGLNDGVMPKKYSDEGLILEEEKLYLKSKGLDLETDAHQIMSRDYFSTYVALSKSSHHLHLSYALTDSEGKALRPSLYIDKLKRVFPDLKEVSHLLETRSPVEAYTRQEHFNHLGRALRAYADGKTIDHQWFGVLNWYFKDDEWLGKSQALKDSLFYNNRVSTLGRTSAKALFDLPLKASVSRLENYAKCPYAHFIKYGLKPQARKKHELKLPDIGLLFHQTLEAFDGWVHDNNKSWMALEEGEVYDVVDHLVHDLVANYNHYIFQSSHRYEYLINKLIRVGKRAIWTLVVQIQQGEFQPYAHEIQFALKGGPASVPPIMIGLANGEKVLLEGRIDRVDLYEKNGQTYVKIIDYKSGRQGFDLSNVYHGLQLQLMVYLNAILSNHDFFKTDLLHPAGVFYFKIDDPLIESESLKEGEAQAALLSRMKMDGILLKDVDIACAMDKNLREKKKSEIIPFDMKKDDTISSRSKVAEAQEFIGLIEHINGVIMEMGQGIHEGNIDMKPYKIKTKNGCQICDYKSICQFDTSFGNTYRHLQTYKNEDVFEMIKGKEAPHGPVDK